MRRYYRAKALILALSLAFSLFSACDGKSEISPSPAQSKSPGSTPTPFHTFEPTPTPSETPTESATPSPEIKKDVSYFFYDYILLGSYEEGEWFSRNDSYYNGSLNTRTYTIGELLNVDTYELYTSGGEKLNKPVSVTFAADGLDSVLHNPANATILKQSAKSVDDFGQLSFALPTKLPDDAAKLRYAEYNGVIMFSDIFNELTLVSSAKHDPRPSADKKIVDVNDKDIAAVKACLTAGGIPGANVDIYEKAAFDLDGDGQLEHIILAMTPWRDWTLTLTKDEVLGNNSGSYAVALCEKNGMYSTLVSKTVPYELNLGLTGDDLTGEKMDEIQEIIHNPPFLFEVSLGGVFDMNGDGKYEIIIEMPDFEMGSNHVFSLVDGNWREIMSNQYGM